MTADTPAEFAKKLRVDFGRNGKIIRENKLKPSKLRVHPNVPSNTEDPIKLLFAT